MTEPHEISGSGFRLDIGVCLHFDRWRDRADGFFRHVYAALWVNKWRVFIERHRATDPQRLTEWSVGCGRWRVTKHAA